MLTQCKSCPVSFLCIQLGSGSADSSLLACHAHGLLNIVLHEGDSSGLPYEWPWERPGVSGGSSGCYSGAGEGTFLVESTSFGGCGAVSFGSQSGMPITSDDGEGEGVELLYAIL
jgi:hypothetical protein